jgi:hypothetical protein
MIAETKTIHTKPPLQKTLQGILHRESESKKKTKNSERAGNTKSQERKRQESRAYQTLKQQKQLNDKDHHIPISTNTEH